MSPQTRPSGYPAFSISRSTVLAAEMVAARYDVALPTDLVVHASRVQGMGGVVCTHALAGISVAAACV